MTFCQSKDLFSPLASKFNLISLFLYYVICSNLFHHSFALTFSWLPTFSSFSHAFHFVRYLLFWHARGFFNLVGLLGLTHCHFLHSLFQPMSMGLIIQISHIQEIRFTVLSLSNLYPVIKIGYISCNKLCCYMFVIS